jgi:hypothetical protein
VLSRVCGWHLQEALILTRRSYREFWACCDVRRDIVELPNKNVLPKETSIGSEGIGLGPAEGPFAETGVHALAPRAPATEVTDSSAAAPTPCWHRVRVCAEADPVTGELLLVVSQTDVNDIVRAQQDWLKVL